MQAKGFTRDEFAASHPGGTLGRKLLTHVRDVMRTGENAPRVAHTATAMDGMLEMSRGRMGMTAVLDEHGRVIGIFTDGDLRRSLEKGVDLRTARDHRCHDARRRAPSAPTSLPPRRSRSWSATRSTSCWWSDEDQKLLGALNMHDLFRAKVI